MKLRCILCPYCEFPTDCDRVDVGIGMMQCGPYHCERCGASQIHPDDTRVLTEQEKKTGWYEPGTPCSELANSIDGKPISHEVAHDLYRMGLPYKT